MGRLAAIALCVLLLGWHSERRVVILGDSIARGYGAEVTGKPDHAPASVLRRALGRDVDNRGVDGLRIAPVVSQVRSLPQGVRAFVHVGVNDVVTDNPQALADLDRLLAAIRLRQDARFVVATIGPLGTYGSPAREQVREAMNSRLAAFRAPNATVIPFAARHYMPDGLHPDWQGYDDAMPEVVTAIKSRERR